MRDLRVASGGEEKVEVKKSVTVGAQSKAGESVAYGTGTKCLYQEPPNARWSPFK